MVLNRWAAFLHDVMWVPAVILLAYWIRFNLSFSIPTSLYEGFWRLLIMAIPIQGAAYWIFGLYRGIWRYASLQDLVRVVKAVLLGFTILVGIAAFWFRLESIPRSVFILYPILLIPGLTAPRILYRWYKEKRLSFDVVESKRTLVVGAGRHGEQLVRDIRRYPEYLPVAIVDDDPLTHGREIHGIRVRGGIDDLGDILVRFNVELVLVAIPSASRSVIRKIVNIAGKEGAECRTLPTTLELVNQIVDVNMIRPVTVEDILGREPVEIDSAAIASFISGKKVLITGGGGSIGSELCRQVAKQKPAQLIVLEHSEYNLYAIGEEFKLHFPDVAVECVLGDTKNRDRVNWLFTWHRPDIVFHAAAYKHVPMLEFNPAEGVCNNVFGTKIIADAACAHRVEKFVLVSTDKAVNPANVMGATKRIAEIYCQNLNYRSETQFITTRFGNVIGSAGSVVPLFQKQIASGGPVTVTHRDIKRFFMTIPEAVLLILQAAVMGEGGEIFVLDMGEQILIRDLAEQMIRLSGFEPGEDIEIVYTGLRRGEKLSEELFHGREDLQGTSHAKLQLSNSRRTDWNWLTQQLEELREAAKERDVDKLRHRLKSIVPEYHYKVD